MSGEENWRTPSFRQSVVTKIDEAIQRSGMPTNKKGIEMENTVFQRAKSKDEYLSFVARLILHVREMSKNNDTKKGGGMGGNSNQGMQDPINALQNLARQGNQMGNQMSNQMGNQLGSQMSNQMASQLGNQMGNQMANQMANPMGSQMASQMTNQMNVGLVPPPLPPQANNSNLMQALNPRPSMPQKIQPQPPQAGMMMGGMVGSPLSGQMPPAPPGQRKVDAMGAYRAAVPAQFSPTQQPQSVGGPNSNQMIPSPALVPSPNNPQMARSMNMNPGSSPGSSLNTPGGGPSPCTLSQEEAAYRDKIRQLSKYIEPLRRMIARVGNEDVEKLSKMKALLDILANPNKRMPLETLLKCEVALEKIDFKRGEGGVVREMHPLIEALKSNLQSPVLNHTLQRTFGPCMEALFGSDFKTLPAAKRKKIEESPDDIPEVLQGEIARLDQRFKVSLDPSSTGVGSRSVQLLCWLDDRHLPCVPPVSVTVPEDYPSSPPRCYVGCHEHSATAFLSQVQAALESRVSKLPAKYTVSQLLDTWEMSVRQACAPSPSAISLPGL